MGKGDAQGDFGNLINTSQTEKHPALEKKTMIHN